MTRRAAIDAQAKRPSGRVVMMINSGQVAHTLRSSTTSMKILANDTVRSLKGVSSLNTGALQNCVHPPRARLVLIAPFPQPTSVALLSRVKPALTLSCDGPCVLQGQKMGDWQEVTDPGSGRTYFYSPSTGATQ